MLKACSLTEPLVIAPGSLVVAFAGGQAFWREPQYVLTGLLSQESG